MVTRRVKRIKRSKKQVHRARGRKTNRRRYTRRQIGGMLGFNAAMKGFVKMVGTNIINTKGGSMFDGIEVFRTGDDAFHIGNRRLDQYDASSDPNDRVYAAKIRFYLKAAKIQHDNDDMIVLDTSNFNKFKTVFESNRFVPTAAHVAAPAPVAEKPDSNKIFIKSNGVQFGANFKSWVSNTCEFSDDENPCFTQYVFTKHEKPTLVNVKYVMHSMDAKTYCALEAYEARQLYSLVPRFDYGLISPGVTVEFVLQEKGEITSSFVAIGIQLSAHYESCEEPYNDGLYTFYKDRNSLVAAMFFDKPDKVEWSDQVYINLIKNHIDEGKKNVINPIFPKEQTSIMIRQLNEFDNRLTQLIASPNSEGLKQLDSEVTDYIRTGFQRSLFQAKRTKALSGPGAAGRP